MKKLLLFALLLAVPSWAKHKDPPTPARATVYASVDLVKGECIKMFQARGYSLANESDHMLVFTREMTAKQTAVTSLLIGSASGEAKGKEIIKLTIAGAGSSVTVTANIYIPGHNMLADVSTKDKTKEQMQIALDMIKGNAERDVPATASK